MKNNQTINDIFESWGKSKREVPLRNEILKNEILSKVQVPFAVTHTSNHSRVPWLSFAFATMAVIVLIVNVGGGDLSKQVSISEEYTATLPSVVMPEVANQVSPGMRMDGRDLSYSPPYFRVEDEASINDTREFQKVNYNSSLKTRKVSLLASRIETIIRGFGGRIDGVNSEEKGGYISFVLPKEDLSAFREQIKDLVGAKFYTENINSQNLLPEKQMIEENQEYTKEILNDLKTERAQVVKSHAQTVSSYQNQIDSRERQIAILNMEYPSANSSRQAQIINSVNQLQAEINTFKSKIYSENKNYQYQIAQIDSQIKNTEGNLEALKKQDTRLLDNVATVNGSISLSWISLWEMADIYVPGALLFYIFLAAAFISYFWYQRTTRIPEFV